MASLVCGWLALVDAPYVEPGAVGPGGTGGSSSAFDAGPLAGLAADGGGGGVGGGGGGAEARAGPNSTGAGAGAGAAGSAGAGGAGGGAGGAPDEFTLLQELARRRFDPERLLAVFRAGRPGWLHELTADARGRRLVLDLSARHRGSIFLNYAIRRIFDTVRRRRRRRTGFIRARGFVLCHQRCPLFCDCAR